MFKNVIANFLLSVLPVTRMFWLKRTLLNVIGFELSDGVKICGGTKFYGRGRVIIGKDCWIGIGCRFYTAPNAHVRIGDRCDIAPQCTFITGTHLQDSLERRAGTGVSIEINIGDGCWVGCNTTFLAGGAIGNSVVVGACSLINKKFGNNFLLVGIPAEEKKSYNDQNNI